MLENHNFSVEHVWCVVNKMKNRDNNNNLSDYDAEQQLPANQLSRIEQDVESVVRGIVTNVQSQDMFSNPLPAVMSSQSAKKKKNSSQQLPMLPKTNKPNKQTSDI